MNIISFLVTTVFAVTSLAESLSLKEKSQRPLEASAPAVEMGPYGPEKKVRLSFASIFRNNTMYRGALTYDVPVMFIGPGIIFFDKITFRGPGITYTESFGKRHKLSGSLYYFDDKPASGPVITLASKKDEDYKNGRRATTDASIKYEYRYERLFSFSLDYHKDIYRHFGNYVAVGFNTGALKYVTLGIEIGIGDKDSNQFAYGPEAVSGLGHINYKLSSFLPILPWGGKLIPSYIMSTIQQKENKNSDFVRGNDINHTVSVVFTWELYSE